MTWSLPGLVERHAAEVPEAIAIRDDTRVISWADLQIQATVVSNVLANRGVSPGVRVALAMPPSGELVAAIIGVQSAGAVAAPIPSGLTTRETEAALEVLTPALVLREGEAAAAAGAAHTPLDPDPEAPVVVVLTSGTTGRPKGVVLSGRAMAASADAWLAVLPPVTGWAMPLGLAHVAGLGILWRAVRDRVPVTLLPPTDPGALIAALAAESGPSHVSLVPGQLVRLLDATNDAAPPPTRARRPARRRHDPGRARRARARAPAGRWSRPTASRRWAPASRRHGRPLPGTSITIDEPGSDGVGEIVVSGPSRFSGYLGEPAAQPDAPFRTGDLGRLDEDGRLVVVDRRTDRIVRGGENIDPGEVEAVLEAHPSIAAAAVVGRPDETWGQVPVAAIVLARRRRRSRRRAPSPPMPARRSPGSRSRSTFARLDALPRTSGGKLRREAVRALLAGEPAGELARPDGDAIGWRVTGSGPTTA